ncbi:S1C family serine protease [Ornithinibacillus halotolerans]|uniref:Peptidase S1 n=1 Tax=Ornithinibacillus halotolerans TaxID=1274357 RepID=A0A916S882_9BACI|nr:trypsin-like peptidase domain-containing protein [Ornithinibacillus halotolerans]GGA87769.1 peptidase S1 [Ornithinibacillus halotolerans]
MVKTKRKIPLFITVVIIILGLVSMIYLYFAWKSESITVSNPIIKKIETDNTAVNLKTIIHETEKFVVQIETQNEYETLTGSGFLYNDKGDIITNAHVVKDAETIYVRTANAQVYPAAIIGIGEETDVAVIRVPQLAGEGGLQIDKESFAEIGDEVIALGSPHGFQNTVTLGIISGTERDFSVNTYNYNNVYQISALITHGNSGGPLINRETGLVIGINSVGTNDGTIGFSIPILDVLQEVETWSKEAQNSQLTFTNTDHILNSIDSEQFTLDAEYVMEYFLDSIIIRDYVAAYSLFGDSIQSEVSYTNFRENYIQVVDIIYDHHSTSIVNNNHASILVDVQLTKNNPNKEENIEEKIQYEFLVGYENDQLKIIGIEYLED